MISLFLSFPALQLVYVGLFVVGICYNTYKTNPPITAPKSAKLNLRVRKNRVFKNRIMSSRKTMYWENN